MINYIKITLCSFTIWVLAALINALLSAVCLLLAPQHSTDWQGNFCLSFVFTLLFSGPSLFIFWLIFLFNKKEDSQSLFQLLFRFAFFSAAFSAVVFAITFYERFGSCVLLLAVSIVLAAIASLMCHHYFIITIYKSKLPKHA